MKTLKAIAPILCFLYYACSQDTIRQKESTDNSRYQNVSSSSNQTGSTRNNTTYTNALQEHISELNQMNNKARSAAECDMRERGIDRASEVREWLQGNWEWNGTIDGYRNSCRLGVSDDYAVLATPRGVLDQGKITIDFEDKTIHFGSTYINFDYENGRLGDFSNGMYYRKMSRSSGSDSRSFYSSSSSSYSSTTFHTSAEVLSYTGGKFRDRSGNVISIRQEGIYANGGYPRGQLITNAVKVVRFDATSALLTTSSPYGGGGAMYIRVDASQGTITDGSGCVYYKQ